MDPHTQADVSMLARQAEALVDNDAGWTGNLSNIAALVFDELPALNWVGFYLLDGETLRLGPFQGRPACTRIERGTGVCGAAVERARTVVVEDVHAFDGHIACDPRSRSEVVVPLTHDGRLHGVLDVDSPQLRRFGPADVAALEQVAAICAPWAARRTTWP